MYDILNEFSDWLFAFWIWAKGFTTFLGWSWLITISNATMANLEKIWLAQHTQDQSNVGSIFLLTLQLRSSESDWHPLPTVNESTNQVLHFIYSYYSYNGCSGYANPSPSFGTALTRNGWIASSRVAAAISMEFTKSAAAHPNDKACPEPNRFCCSFQLATIFAVPAHYFYLDLTEFAVVQRLASLDYIRSTLSKWEIRVAFSSIYRRHKFRCALLVNVAIPILYLLCKIESSSTITK